MIAGYTFRDPTLLVEALTHSSLANEASGQKDYERLEFLGDAVLQLVVTELLMQSRPVWKEGRLSGARQNVVNKELLAEVAQALGLPALIHVAPGQQEVRDQRKVWSQVFESVLGAIYEDGGWEAARAWARPLIAPHLARLSDTRDPKSRLQEWAQLKTRVLPIYDTTDTEGPDHRLTFTVTVTVAGKTYGPASGRSRKEAEKAVAQLALDALVASRAG